MAAWQHAPLVIPADRVAQAPREPETRRQHRRVGLLAALLPLPPRQRLVRAAGLPDVPRLVRVVQAGGGVEPLDLATGRIVMFLQAAPVYMDYPE